VDRLRSLWDFADLDLAERRLRRQLEEETSPAGRAEVLTQLARVEGLRGRFTEGEQRLREAEDENSDAPVVRARLALERGRLRRSGGDAGGALPLFEAAVAAALEAGEPFLAADAAHMAALAAPDPHAVREWTQRGIDLAERSPEACYWLGPLLNNLGWHHYERGEYAAALDAFERALTARERDDGRPLEVEIARYAVGRTLRALGRPAEAAARLEQAVAWAEAADRPDSYFHEELAEDYAALGREAEAAEQARKALALVEPDDPRAARLRELLQPK
jgi:tetratricopeptide (TPR) repeat protein